MQAQLMAVSFSYGIKWNMCSMLDMNIKHGHVTPVSEDIEQKKLYKVQITTLPFS